MAKQKCSANVTSLAQDLFVDALEEYSTPEKILTPFLQWHAVHPTSFENAYMHMYIPKLLAPIVRQQLLLVDILKVRNFIQP